MRLISTILVAGILSGCTTLIPPQTSCTSCIGPYDITLSSHREAILGERP